MSSRSTLWRGSFQALRAEFQDAAAKGPGLRHLLVRPLGTAAELPERWRRAVDEAESKITTEWSPPCTGYLDWDRAEAAYLYGASSEVAAFAHIARRAWLAYPGSPNGKAQMAPRQNDADRWLTVVHRQLRDHPGTYFEADGDEWAAFDSDAGVRVLPVEQLPQDPPPVTAGRWRITALATDVFTASVVAIDALLASPDDPYAISWQEMDAWQKSPAFQNANFLVDMIRLGEGRTFPIYRYWCRAVDGGTPSICPNADPPADARDRAVLRHYLPAIERRFRDLRLVGDGQTVHWVGRQASLGSLCRCEFGKPESDIQGLHEGSIVSENTPAGERPQYTLGQLISDLEGKEKADERNAQMAERSAVEAPFLRWRPAQPFQPDTAQHPGIDRIEMLCDEWGTGLKAENVRKLRGKLCTKLELGLTSANAMALGEVADALIGDLALEPSSEQEPQVGRRAVEPASHMADLSLAERKTVAGLADLFVDFDFLPNSFAGYTWREAASENGLLEYWQEGSKRPAVVRLLESALQHHPDSFAGLILTAVQRGIKRREGKYARPYPPITREVITTLIRLMADAGLPIPAELNAPAFLDSLPPGTQDAQPPDPVSSVSAVQPRSQRIGDVPTRASFGWLHLTDLHFGMSGQECLWPNVREEFFSDLEKLHRKSGPWDFVLFTGDFVQKGGTDEFKGLNELLVRLWEHLRRLGSDPYLLGVPGNHDLVRPNPGDAAVAALRTGWNDAEVRREFWGNSKSGYRRMVKKAFKNYTAWWDEHTLPRLDTHKSGLLPGDFSATLEKDGVKVGVVGLNTTFLQLEGGDYERKLALSPQQLHAACGGDGVDWVRGHQVCLLLTHQPPHWLTPESRSDLYGEIARPGRFATHLFGHMHEAAARSLSQGGADARREWQGCSLFGLEEWGEAAGKKQRLHGYAAGRIEVEGEQGTIRQWPRLAVPHQAEHLHIVPAPSFTLEEDGGTRPEPVLVVARPTT